jgi:hypothetical protein
MEEYPRAHQELLRSPMRWAELASVPQALRPILARTLNDMHDDRFGRGSVESRLNQHVRVAATLSKRGVPTPELRTEATEELIEDVTLRLRSAEQFLLMSESAGWMELPVLIYYGLMQTIGAVTRALFSWDASDLQQHGITQRKEEHTGDIAICDRGAFPRAMTTLTLITGTPSAFDRLALVPERDPVDTKNSIKRSWTMDELLNIDPGTLAVRYIDANDLHGQLHSQHCAWSTAVGMDLLVAFTASSWARYHPARWLSREHSLDQVLLDDTFERCRKLTKSWRGLLRGSTNIDADYPTYSEQIAAASEELNRSAPPNPKW